ncbi:SAM-dependent methyltransferase [Bacillus sp. NEB1478]|uniref:SAM-dependent methyltransferase n=1 Tax=Bacillus sp. NEB1478 TaxID=3073816 RepID=UPI0028734D6E|nr:SAM-dependent methyltransferase [Bacillus sp. NEB1478]WNB93552.1 SAM-dependent methyltransferase [Bacillus sp. NEB1478]
MSLQTIFKERLDKNMYLTMEKYMELALYHPDFGYYMNHQEKIGKKGDFYTSSSVSEVFGEVWAKVFVRSIKAHKLDPIVVEFGGGNGNFAKQVLQTWKREEYGESLSYIIVEKSPYHRELLKEKLKKLPVTIISTLDDLIKEFPLFKGIVFANEVLDAFPLRIFQNRRDNWFEKTVWFNQADNRFKFQYVKTETSLFKQLNSIFNSRPMHFDLEVSFQMLEWLEDVYRWVKEDSLLFFVDYGYINEQWSMESLKEGSIRGYFRHQLVNDPLSNTGEMDITYHVDWDQVIKTASMNNIETIALHSQGDFLLQEGLLKFLTNSVQRDPFSMEHKRNRAIRTFLLDHSLAGGFQVLQQKKRSVN